MKRQTPYLSCGDNILDRVNSKTEDVVIMTKVELLGVSLFVVDNTNCCDVIHDFASLHVE